MRPRSGSTFKRTKGKKITWWARLKYVDEAGKHHDLQRRAENKAHAEELREKLVREFDTGGERLIRAEGMNFQLLADHCKEHYFQKASYSKGGY